MVLCVQLVEAPHFSHLCAPHFVGPNLSLDSWTRVSLKRTRYTLYFMKEVDQRLP